MTERPLVEPFGDAAFLVTLGDRIDEELNDRVHRLTRALVERLLVTDGWGTIVPSYASLLVGYDPERLDHERADRDLRTALITETEGARSDGGPSMDTRAEASADPPVEIPVRYGGDDGPDLAHVATATQLDEAEVIGLHADRIYRVFMLGFLPGFAYLGPLEQRLRLPRRSEVRPRVPRGSVAIAGEQTAVYPLETPGGWHIIGRTRLVLWDPAADPPALLRAGQRVRFVPEA